MRNLVPLVGLEEARRDIDAAAAFAHDHQDPSGFGWTDMYVVAAPSKDYSDVGLTLEAAAQALSPIMPRVKRFGDPYGSYDDNAWAFGLGSRCYIKLECEGDLVKSIWFDLRTADAEDVFALRRAIEAINDLIPSAISDYSFNAVVRIGDQPALDAYFQEWLA